MGNAGIATWVCSLNVCVDGVDDGDSGCQCIHLMGKAVSQCNFRSSVAHAHRLRVSITSNRNVMACGLGQRRILGGKHLRTLLVGLDLPVDLIDALDGGEVCQHGHDCQNRNDPTCKQADNQQGNPFGAL